MVLASLGHRFCVDQTREHARSFATPPLGGGGTARFIVSADGTNAVLVLQAPAEGA
jgi:hypothetical protein